MGAVMRRGDVRWQHALATILVLRLRAPFRWQDNTCLDLAAAAARISLGPHPALDALPGFRSRIATETGFRRAMRKMGFRSLAGWAETVLVQAGMAEIAPSRADRGDIVLCRPAGGPETLGVIDLCGKVAIMGQDGLMCVSPRRAQIERAWSAG